MPLLPLLARVKDTTAASLLPPKSSASLAVLILFFASTQLGYHFWPASSFVYGVRVDYLSPTLYFLDLLIILYLSLNQKFHKLVIGNWLLIILLVNLLFTSNPLATLSWSLHFLLYLAFISSLAPPLIHNSLSIILSFGMLFQVVLGAAQVALGHSLQGPLYYLGERFLTVGSSGIASAPFFSELIIRAYGTFGHPNVHAGWLVVCLLIVLRLTRSRVTAVLVTALAALGVLLAQSRSAALTLFFIIIPLFLLKSLRTRLLYFLLLLAISYYLLNSSFVTRDLDLSINQRLNLQQISSKIIQSHPLFGSGASAAISLYPAVAPSPRLLQPDHNSLTLLLSWFGLFGLIALFSIIHHSKYSVHILPLLLLLLLDHYLLTSPQGLFLLLLYLKVVNYPHAVNPPRA